MRENERVIEMRMQKVQEEKRNMEDKLYKAAVCIQKVARGMIARVSYKRQVED